jgi:hypothetical protein
MSELFLQNSKTYIFDTLPELCPYCHFAIQPKVEFLRMVNLEDADLLHVLLSWWP